MIILTGLGRFVKQPELKEITKRDGGETCVCEFTLACNEVRKIKGERHQDTAFIDFVIWDKAAEVVAQYCKQGDLLQVKATPKTQRWTNAEGKNFSRIVYRVDEFAFVPRGKRNDNDKNDVEDVVEDNNENPF